MINCVISISNGKIRSMELEIGCVILAGGKSSRMGQDKALLRYEGKFFIEKIAEELNFFEEKMIARGNNAELENLVKKDLWKVVPDEYENHGPLGGLHAALKKCKSDAMFVVTCDMPLISRKLIKKMCYIYEQEDKSDAVIAVTNDGRLHPLCGIYCKNLYACMEKNLLQNNNRMMSILKESKVTYIQLDDLDSKYLRNINTRVEYQNLIRGNDRGLRWKK